MSEAVTWAKAQTVGNPVAKAVLVCLASWADADGYCWSPIGVMAFELERSERTVQRGLSVLLAMAGEGGPLLPTTRKHLREGKLLPVYRLNRDVGPASTREALRGRAARELGVTRVSPQDGLPDEAWGDTGVTPRGDIDDRLGVTSTTPHHLKGEEKEERELSGAGAREADLFEIEDGLRRVARAWTAAMPDGVAPALDAAAWVAAVETMGDVAALVAAALAYLAKSPAVKAGRGKSLIRWLAERQWETWAPKPTVAEQGPPQCACPPELRARLVALTDSGFVAAYVDPSGWDEAGRALIPHTGLARSRLLDRLRRHLPDLGFSIAERKT